MDNRNIDFDEIQKAMEDVEREAFDYFFDRVTGEVIILSSDILRRAEHILGEDMDDDMGDYEEIEFDHLRDVPEWMEDEIELALEIFLDGSARYIRIPERDRTKAFSIMKEFLLQPIPEELRADLQKALEGRGAFRRFKDLLDDYPKERKLWYGFNAHAVREEIGQWLSGLETEGRAD